MYPTLFHVGRFQFGTYALFALLGLTALVLLLSWFAKRDGHGRWEVIEATLWAFIAGLVASKLFGAVVGLDTWDWEKFTNALLRHAGHYYVGLLAGVPFLAWLLKRQGISPWRALDWLAPSLALGHGIGRIGCFLQGCCWGKPCDLPWAVTFPDAAASRGVPVGMPVHPTQLYEAGFEILLAGFLAWRLLRHRWRDGSTFFLYLGLYGAARFGIEFLRDDPRGRWPFLDMPTSQPLALMSVAAAIVGLAWLARRPPARAKAPAAPAGDESQVSTTASPRKRRKR